MNFSSFFKGLFLAFFCLGMNFSYAMDNNNSVASRDSKRAKTPKGSARVAPKSYIFNNFYEEDKAVIRDIFKNIDSRMEKLINYVKAYEGSENNEYINDLRNLSQESIQNLKPSWILLFKFLKGAPIYIGSEDHHLLKELISNY